MATSFRRRTSRNFQGAGPRRPRQWSIINLNGSVINAANPIVFNLVADLEAALSDIANNWTASALRLQMTVERVAGGSASDFAQLMWGVGWFNNQALAAGVTSLPDPRADNADWYAHGVYHWHASGTGARNADDANSQVLVRTDSMRKQRENNSSLVMVVAAVASDVAVQVIVQGRVLFILP